MTALNSKPNQHILIVDDDDKLRIMLGLMLAKEGYTVSHANNGQQAISLYRSRPCDLVITELTVGGRDSFQTIMELRRQPVPAKFIATARVGWMPPDFCLRMAEHLGAHSVLAKPFKPEQLLEAVRNALE
jgi:DNA-binding response OmpR family regulator